MALEFLYIDDENEEVLEPLVQAINKEPRINIEVEHPCLRGLDIKSLGAALNGFDGLILDWRLDDIVASDGASRYPFTAGALAQELRTKQTEKQAKPIPIVLWSTEEKLRGLFSGDQTGHDLFDFVFYKSRISEDTTTVQNEMISLALGYQLLNDLPGEEMGLPSLMLQTEPEYLDTRLKQHLKTSSPIHDHAGFILKELIERPGLLVDDKLLAARLGIDIEQSHDWGNLLGKLPGECRYEGPFNEAWPRWWTKCIEQIWWRSLQEPQRPLSALEAEDRVSIIKDKLALAHLIAATPICPSYNKKFYAICEYNQRPLDPVDGVIIDEPEPEPWQDRRYLSLDAALERRGEAIGIFPHVTEETRLSEIKKVRTSKDE